MSPLLSLVRRPGSGALAAILVLTGALGAQSLPSGDQPASGDGAPIPAASTSSRALTETLARAIAERPVTVPFQRSVADAERLARASGKPLLICVNMDGETASDSLASGRYRDPAFGELAAGCVPVIASPDRHAPDRDGRGRRIPCPRFGGVTCSEHMAVEPDAYDRWFGGQRVAPRHVLVSPEGQVIEDLYLLHDLSVIDRTLAGHGRPDLALPELGETPDVGWAGSADRRAREALEQAFVDGALGRRLGLVQLALDPAREVGQPELLWLALRDRAPLVRRAAAERVVALSTLADADLLVEAARELGHDPHAREILASALTAAGLGEQGDGRARRLGQLLPAAYEPSPAVDVAAWSAALALAPAEEWTEPDTDALYEEVGRLGEAVAAEPDRADLRRQLAQTVMDLADGYQAAAQEDVSWLWEQALESARRATELDRRDGLAWALLARADWLLGGTEVAADAASRALPRLLDQGAGALRVVDTLDVLVATRGSQVNAALASDAPVDPASVSEVLAATRVLLLHPLTADWQLAIALDTVGGWELDALHTELTLAALERFPASPDLHDHLRWHLLRDGDPADVVTAYDRLAVLDTVRGTDAGRWFAAYAALAAGDQLRSELRHDAARSAYDLALARFDAGVEGDLPFRALALAGMGRVQLAEGDALAAAGSLQQALSEAPDAMTWPASDGETPAATARTVVRALRAAREMERADALREAFAAVD